MKPYLLFDAGGTLLYPHAEVICEVCSEHGLSMNPDTFLNGFYGAIHKLDNDLRAGADTTWIPSIAAVGLNNVGVVYEKALTIANESISRTGESHFWTYSRPWVRAALEKLNAAGYRMSVISNADGTVEQQLDDLELTQYFERVFDSAVVGVEKPDPRIFSFALAELQLSAAECIYIGDVYHIDVLGANRAEMAAVHIDPYGRYDQWPGYHVRSVEDYADRLIAGRLITSDASLTPFRHDDIPATGA